MFELSVSFLVAAHDMFQYKLIPGPFLEHKLNDAKYRVVK